MAVGHIGMINVSFLRLFHCGEYQLSFMFNARIVAVVNLRPQYCVYDLSRETFSDRKLSFCKANSAYEAKEKTFPEVLMW